MRENKNYSPSIAIEQLITSGFIMRKYLYEKTPPSGVMSFFLDLISGISKSYLVLNLADPSNDIVRYITKIYRKQGITIFKGYVDLFGYPEEFDKKLTKQQKLLYGIDKKQ